MEIKDGKYYIPQVKKIILEYAQELNRDLSFQHIDKELENLSDKYTLPNGEIVVAVDDNNNVIGIVAYYKHNANRCEMKRLYVKPEARGLHCGDLLIKDIIKRARLAGYKEIVLDTITPLKTAIELYKKNGFIECVPYYDNPMEDIIYMIKKL